MDAGTRILVLVCWRRSELLACEAPRPWWPRAGRQM